MKKVIAIITMMLLAGCTTQVDGFWIRAADIACKNKEGVYAIYFSSNPNLVVHSVRCNNGDKLNISKIG